MCHLIHIEIMHGYLSGIPPNMFQTPGNYCQTTGNYCQDDGRRLDHSNLKLHQSMGVGNELWASSELTSHYPVSHKMLT